MMLAWLCLVEAICWGRPLICEPPRPADRRGVQSKSTSPVIYVVCSLGSVDGDLAQQRDGLVVPIEDEGVIGRHDAVISTPHILHTHAGLQQHAGDRMLYSTAHMHLATAQHYTFNKLDLYTVRPVFIDSVVIGNC